MTGQRHYGLITATILVLAFLYLPIISVMLNAFNSDTTLTSWGGATTKWFHQAWNDPQVRSGFKESIRIATISTVLSLVIAICAGLYWRKAALRGRRALDATTYMRIALPEVMTALALFTFFRRLNITLGEMTIVVGHVVFNSAYATIVIQARLATMNQVLEDAAADLGARPRRVFTRVTLPLLAPAIIVAGLLVFTFSFDDVVTSAFLAGSGAETLPMLILGLVRYHVTPEVNAIGFGVMMITLGTFALALAVIGARSITWRRRASAPVEEDSAEPMLARAGAPQT